MERGFWDRVRRRKEGIALKTDGAGHMDLRGGNWHVAGLRINRITELLASRSEPKLLAYAFTHKE